MEIEKVQRTAAYGFARRDDRVLMVSVRRDHVSADRAWMLPGGGIEHGEHPEQAVIRELGEETGFDVTVGRLCFVGNDHRMVAPTIDFHCVYFVYTVTIVGGGLRPEIGGSSTAPSWVPVSELDDDTVLPAIRPGLDAALAGLTA